MSDPLELARQALAGADVWLVGGAIRDRVLAAAGVDVTPHRDLDLIVDGDVRAAAKALARAARGPAFELSDAFGAWRVIAHDRSWQADLTPLRGGSLDADLSLRDFTVNAIAEPLEGGDPVDPFGGLEDLAARRLRPVGPSSFADDPLRVLRLARLACELGLHADEEAIAAAREHAAGLADIAQERVFGELKRIITADAAVAGLQLAERAGALAVVLPELTDLHGVEQTVYHHRDAHGHTLEVLERAIDIDRDPVAALGPEHGPRVRAVLDEPLADELTRSGGLRLGALLHDIAKARTAVPSPKGGFGFPGHDREGAVMVREILTRLRASEHLKRHVADLTRHHLRAGFLVHRRVGGEPLSRRDVFEYLKATGDVCVDVTLLSLADRLATRGRKHGEAIAKHEEVIGDLLGPALDWHEHGPPPPLVRGDELARELGRPEGPWLGEMLDEIAAARYAGEIATREDAIRYARDAAPSPR
jgi:putative nucleotidyltransferase with HDIG domain